MKKKFAILLSLSILFTSLPSIAEDFDDVNEVEQVIEAEQADVIQTPIEEIEDVVENDLVAVETTQPVIVNKGGAYNVDTEFDSEFVLNSSAACFAEPILLDEGETVTITVKKNEKRTKLDVIAYNVIDELEVNFIQVDWQKSVQSSEWDNDYISIQTIDAGSEMVCTIAGADGLALTWSDEEFAFDNNVALIDFCNNVYIYSNKDSGENVCYQLTFGEGNNTVAYHACVNDVVGKSVLVENTNAITVLTDKVINENKAYNITLDTSIVGFEEGYLIEYAFANDNYDVVFADTNTYPNEVLTQSTISIPDASMLAMSFLRADGNPVTLADAKVINDALNVEEIETEEDTESRYIIYYGDTNAVLERGSSYDASYQIPNSIDGYAVKYVTVNGIRYDAIFPHEAEYSFETVDLNYGNNVIRAYLSDELGELEYGYKYDGIALNKSKNYGLTTKLIEIDSGKEYFVSCHDSYMDFEVRAYDASFQRVSVFDGDVCGVTGASYMSISLTGDYTEEDFYQNIYVLYADGAYFNPGYEVNPLEYIITVPSSIWTSKGVYDAPISLDYRGGIFAMATPLSLDSGVDVLDYARPVSLDINEVILSYARSEIIDLDPNVSYYIDCTDVDVWYNVSYVDEKGLVHSLDATNQRSDTICGAVALYINCTIDDGEVRSEVTLSEEELARISNAISLYTATYELCIYNSDIGGGNTIADVPVENGMAILPSNIGGDEVISYNIDGVEYQAGSKYSFADFGKVSAFAVLDYDESNVFFVDAVNGNDANNGHSVDKAVKTTDYAVSRAKTEGKTDIIIVLMAYAADKGKDIQVYNCTSMVKQPGMNIRLTGLYDGIQYPSKLFIGEQNSDGPIFQNNITIDHIDLNGSSKATERGTYCFWYGNGYDITIGEGCTTLIDTFNLGRIDYNAVELAGFPSLSLMGGISGNGTIEGPGSNITVLSGSYGRILAGGRKSVLGSADKYVNTNITVGGTAEVSVVVGGAADRICYVNSNITINGGYVYRLLGSSLGATGTVNGVVVNERYGDVKMVINGGVIEKVTGGAMGRDITRIAHHGNIDIEMNGGTVGEMTCGGAAGITLGNVTFHMTGGKITSKGTAEYPFQGSKRKKLNTTGAAGVVANPTGDFYGGGYGFSDMDNWTHVQTGKNYNLGSIYGTVQTTIEGGEIEGDVYGGGNGYDYKKNNGSSDYYMIAQICNCPQHTTKAPLYEIKTSHDTCPHETPSAYLTITGDAIIDGNVYGGGNGCESSEQVAMVCGGTKVEISDSNVDIKGDIYGGGNNAYVEGGTQVVVKSGVHCENNIYGGGCNSRVSGDALVDLEEDASVNGTVYGAGYRGNVEGDTYVTIQDAHVTGNVFGGGMSSSVGNATHINITGNNTHIEKSVIGGGISGTVGNGDTTNGTHITITGGTFDKDIIGGGLESSAIVNGSSHVTVNGAASISDININGSVLGGAAGSTVKGNVFVTVYGPNVNIKAEENSYLANGIESQKEAGVAIAGNGLGGIVRGDVSVVVMDLNLDANRKVYDGGINGDSDVNGNVTITYRNAKVETTIVGGGTGSMGDAISSDTLYTRIILDDSSDTNVRFNGTSKYLIDVNPDTGIYVGWVESSLYHQYIANDVETDIDSGKTYTYMLGNAFQYTLINFDANGGEGITNSLAIPSEGHGTLTKNGFSKEGYRFIGWSTTPEGEVEYENEADYRTGTVPKEVEYLTVTLYAVWIEGNGIEYMNLSLSGDIGVNVYCANDASLAYLAENGCKLAFSVDGKNKTISLMNGVDSKISGKPCKQFTYNVTPQQMASIITVSIVDADGVDQIEPVNISVRYYANVVLEERSRLINGWQIGETDYSYGDANEEYNRLANMVRKMLNYGAYSQLYNGYNIADLANNIPAMVGYREINSATYSASKKNAQTNASWLKINEEAGSDVRYTSTALVFNQSSGVTGLRVYFVVTGEHEITDITPDSIVHHYTTSKTGTEYLVSDNVEIANDEQGYYVQIDSIPAGNLDTVYQIILTNEETGAKATIELSALTYARLLFTNSTLSGNSDWDLAKVVASMYEYNEAAKAYFSL